MQQHMMSLRGTWLWTRAMQRPGFYKRALETVGSLTDATTACDRALALWPDITLLLRLRLHLARRSADPAMAMAALEGLLAIVPNDRHLNGELGELLCQLGDYRRALPFLRIAAPVLLHANNTIWNYIVALALVGAYRELLDIQPLLDRMADTAAGAYTPFRHLASAKLALQFDRAETIARQHALENSPAWRSPTDVLDRIMMAISARDPFSVVCLDRDLAYFV